MKFRPLHDRLLVRRSEEEGRSAGGIIIPDSARERPMQGEVISVGPGARNDRGDIVPPDVKIGDTVLFGKYAGSEVTIDGEEFVILKEVDVLGVLDGKTSIKKKAA